MVFHGFPCFSMFFHSFFHHHPKHRPGHPQPLRSWRATGSSAPRPRRPRGDRLPPWGWPCHGYQFIIYWKGIHFLSLWPYIYIFNIYIYIYIYIYTCIYIYIYLYIYNYILCCLLDCVTIVIHASVELYRSYFRITDASEVHRWNLT